MSIYDPKVSAIEIFTEAREGQRKEEKKRKGKKRGDYIRFPCKFTLLFFNESFSLFS